MVQRDTSQRRAIRQVFRDSDRPLSTHEVLSAAQKLKPQIGIATVYRSLKLLIDSGWLAVVRLPGEPPRYELADKPHHHHFHCRACGRVVEVPGSDKLLSSLVPPGFHLEHHDLVLHGCCDRCIPAQQAASED